MIDIGKYYWIKWRGDAGLLGLEYMVEALSVYETSDKQEYINVYILAEGSFLPSRKDEWDWRECSREEITQYLLEN